MGNRWAEIAKYLSILFVVKHFFVQLPNQILLLVFPQAKGKLSLTQSNRLNMCAFSIQMNKEYLFAILFYHAIIIKSVCTVGMKQLIRRFNEGYLQERFCRVHNNRYSQMRVPLHLLYEFLYIYSCKFQFLLNILNQEMRMICSLFLMHLITKSYIQSVQIAAKSFIIELTAFTFVLIKLLENHFACSIIYFLFFEILVKLLQRDLFLFMAYVTKCFQQLLLLNFTMFFLYNKTSKKILLAQLTFTAQRIN